MPDERIEPEVDETGLIVYDGSVPDDVDPFAEDVGELVTILLVVSLVLALASIGYSIYAYLTAPEPPDNPNQTNSFGFGLANSFNPANPLPVIYGTHKVAGQYFFQQMNNLKTNNILSIGIGLGEGPIDDVTEIKVNNIPMADIQSGNQVGEVTTFLGDVEMPASGVGGGVADIFYTPGFSQDFNDFIDPEDGSITRTTITSTVVRLDAGFFFPQGNFELNDEKGKFRSRVWKMDIDYRIVGDDDWITGPRVRESIKNVGPFRRQIFIAQGLPPAQYQVRFHNRSGINTKDPTTNDVNLDFMSEGLDFADNLFEVGNFAYLALNLEATGTIAGSPNITALVRGRKVDVYNAVGTPPGNQYSDNPAWCILDFLTNTRYGLGNIISLDDIDIQSFIDTGAYLGLTDGNGARHGRLNLALSNVRPALDWLEVMMKSFGGFLQLVGGQIALGVDKDEPSVQAFTESNILVGSLQYDMASKQDTTSVNRLTVRYRNEDKDFATDSFRLQIDSEISGEQDVIEKNIELTGVTKTLDVERQARRILNVIRTNIRSVEFSADMSTVQARVGDVVSITHSLPGWIQKKFRIVSIEEAADQTRKINALEHNASVYTTQDTVVSPVVNTTLFNPFIAPSGVLAVDVSPEFAIQIDGTVQNNLDISWDYPVVQGDYLGLKNFDVYYSLVDPLAELASGTSYNSADDESVFYETISGTVLSGTVGIPGDSVVGVSPEQRFVEIQDLEDNKFAFVQVLPVTTAGVTRRQATEPVFSTFFPTYSGQPSNVDIFTATIANGDGFLTWSAIPTNEAPDLSGYEVRTTNSGFGNDNSEMVFRGTTTSTIDSGITDRTKTYYIKAFNNSGLYSVASVSEQLGDVAPPAITLDTPVVNGANIGLSWTIGASNTTGYEVHVSGTGSFSPDDNSLNNTVVGRNSLTYNYVDVVNASGTFSPNYFQVAAIDSLSETLGDQNYSNEVTASGEYLNTSKNVSGDTDPTFTLQTGPLNGKRLTDAHLSFTTVERSSIELSLSWVGFIWDIESTDAVVVADLRRGVGVNPVSWTSIFTAPNFNLTSGDGEWLGSMIATDMPGEPKTIPIDDGHYSYSVYFTQISGTEFVDIDSFIFSATETR